MGFSHCDTHKIIWVQINSTDWSKTALIWLCLQGFCLFSSSRVCQIKILKLFDIDIKRDFAAQAGELNIANFPWDTRRPYLGDNSHFCTNPKPGSPLSWFNFVWLAEDLRSTVMSSACEAQRLVSVAESWKDYSLTPESNIKVTVIKEMITNLGSSWLPNNFSWSAS